MKNPLKSPSRQVLFFQMLACALLREEEAAPILAVKQWCRPFEGGTPKGPYLLFKEAGGKGRRWMLEHRRLRGKDDRLSYFCIRALLPASSL